MKKNADEFYKPHIRANTKIDGIAAETILPNETGEIISKQFITSLQPNFNKIADSLISFFLGGQASNSLNNLLVVIKPDETAKIYVKFPMSLNIRSKSDMKRGTIVTKSMVADIESVEFFDDIYQVDISDGDKIIWLFRSEWRIGLYYDLSKKLKKDTVYKELGSCFRSLTFYNTYLLLENNKYFELLLKDGWFPFIQLLDNDFDKLIQYYAEEKKYSSHIDDILKKYTKEKIESITQYWWKNNIFNSKRIIIEAGISAYLQNNEAGYINCIKNLSSEIEGVMRIACFKDAGNNNAKVFDLKDYVTVKGTSKFSSTGSLGFPDLFRQYLTEVIFKGFDLKSGDIPISRHSVAHGVANFETYTKIRALQMILILDQIYFFIGN